MATGISSININCMKMDDQYVSPESIYQTFAT